MNYTVDTDLWDLRQRINILEVMSDKHNARLNKLEDTRDEKEQVSADPSELKSNKDYDALDWYKDRYQSIREDYSKVSLELANKQKVLELTIEQRDRYLDQIINQNSMIDALERDFRDSKKTNQKLIGIIKNHEDRILELEKQVEYHKLYANFGTIKELQEQNVKLQKLNDVYTRMILKDE